LPVDRGKIRTGDDNKRRALILPLKNCGVSKTAYQQTTGTGLNGALRHKIKKLESYGLIEEDDKAVKLTETGSFFADEVVMQLYAPEYIPFPKSIYADGPLNPYND
jgi:coproporphyrinogen III oxidase-like Fe-S oxidoreductase